MEDIVAYLRRYGQCSENDEFQGVTYWTDEQLEDIAKARAKRMRFRLGATATDDTTAYRIDAPRHYFLATGYAIWDSAATVVDTLSTYDQLLGELTFASALASDDYYVEGLFVNIYEALMDLWMEKAAQRFDYIHTKGGNNTLHLEQERAQCEKQANYYRNKIIRRHDRARPSRWAL